VLSRAVKDGQVRDVTATGQRGVYTTWSDLSPIPNAGLVSISLIKG
jgi:hypothetical protein